MIRSYPKPLSWCCEAGLINCITNYFNLSSMSDVQIFEQAITGTHGEKFKMAILRGGLRSDNPTEVMNAAVYNYVGSTPYNEFVESFLDNPWVRVIVSGINELDYQEYKNQRL